MDSRLKCLKFSSEAVGVSCSGAENNRRHGFVCAAGSYELLKQGRAMPVSPERVKISVAYLLAKSSRENGTEWDFSDTEASADAKYTADAHKMHKYLYFKNENVGMNHLNLLK